MLKFHLNCKTRYDHYVMLLRKHDDKIGLKQVLSNAESLNQFNRCGYCEKPLNRRANLFRNKKAA